MGEMVKIVVADSSALILLTKIGLIQRIIHMTDMVIPKSVESETANASLHVQFPDAKTIAGLIQDGKIKVLPVTKHKKLPVTLGRGETDAILLFQEINADLLLCDDGKALRACKYLNIPFLISPRLVVELYKRSALQLNIAIESLEQLQELGRYSPDIIGRAFLDLKEAS